MVLIAVKVKDTEEVTCFVKNTHNRFNDRATIMLGNGMCKKIKVNRSIWIVFFSKSLLSLQLHLRLIVVAWVIYSFTKQTLLNWSVLIPLLITSTLYFHSNHFYISLLKKGLKKEGYEKDIKIIEQYELQEKLLNKWLKKK